MPLYQYRAGERDVTLLFIHVPKTGGTAIEAHLRSIGLTGFFDPPTYMPVRPYLKVPPAHYDYDYLNRLFDLDRLYSFAVVRHPVRRMSSEYKWVLERSTLASTLAGMPFSDFIRYMFEQYRRDENVASGHIKPQIRFVGEKERKIFKYEAGLDTIIRRVLQDVGLSADAKITIPVVNKTTDRKVEPTDADIALIREFYAEDFKAFGYDAQPMTEAAQS